MRSLIAAVLVVPAWAHADVTIGGSVGAGAQGAATYGALDLRLDGEWTRMRLGLGARGVWDDAVFRRTDWASPWSAITLVRNFEIWREVREIEVGVAAGALAPARIGHIVDGYRVTLDDRWRTGVRGVAHDDTLDVGIEIDDLLDPALVGGGVRWHMAPPWGMHAALAIDPRAPSLDSTERASAIEVGIDRRYEGELAQLDVGVAVVAEISLGASAVAFADGALERWGVRFTARADARAGTGSVGALFGPLYRIERLAHDGAASLWDRARGGELSGAGAGLTIGAAIPDGWLELGVRTRPGLGGLVVAGAGAPMNRWAQAGVWAAMGAHDAAGAAELRIAWAKTLFSALQAARIYRLDAMEPVAVWSVTAWFGATTE